VVRHGPLVLGLSRRVRGLRRSRSPRVVNLLYNTRLGEYVHVQYVGT